MNNILAITSFEIKRLFKSRLLWVFTCFFAAMYVISAIFFNLYGSEGSVLTNASAQSFPIQHLQASLTFTAIFVAIYVGDITVQDRMNGTIKLTLLRSLSRLQYFISRVLCTFIFSIVMTLIMIVAGYIVGLAFFGWGEYFEFFGMFSSGLHGVGITLLAGFAFALAYFIFGLLILVVSLYFERVATLAMVAGASTLIGQYVILLPTIKHYAIFQQLLFFHIDWFNTSLSQNLMNSTILFIYMILCIAMGYFQFKKKDLFV